ncbi:MAG: epimerase, partial [Longimicrobiales bacterium]
ESVLTVGRTRSPSSHPKLRQLIHTDFFDYSGIADELSGHDACFFCLGVSSAGMGEAEYTRLTYELTMATAGALTALNPRSTFCYVSGEGADRTGQGRFMWARVKGRTENALLDLPFNAYMFRPGFIQPLKGVRSRTPIYRVVYAVLAPLYPLLSRLFARHVTTTVNVGRAMIRVARSGYGSRILENSDINGVAAAARRDSSSA